MDIKRRLNGRVVFFTKPLTRKCVWKNDNLLVKNLFKTRRRLYNAQFRYGDLKNFSSSLHDVIR